MRLYHGTTAPEELIREEGLRVFTQGSLRDYIIGTVGTPKKLIKTLDRAIKYAWGWHFGPGYIYFTEGFDSAAEYASEPGGEIFELIIASPLPMPEGLKDLLDRVRTVAKVVEVDVPDEWLTRAGVRVLAHEVAIPWDIGPQYIKKVISV